MCSVKQSENPYLVHIDHFSDLDDESDELDDLNEACAACGFEAGDCACGKDDDIDAITAGLLNPVNALGYMVKGTLYPVVKLAENGVRGANRMAGNSLVSDAQERDSFVGANEDIRVASMVLDLNRQGEGLKKLWSFGIKNQEDEKNVRAGGRGQSTWWFGYKWAFTKHDKDDFEHGFGILNTRTDVTIQKVKNSKLMTQLAHKMFSTSIFKKLMSIRKMTYREAMNELYKKKSRFRDADDHHALDLWYQRDHGNVDDGIIKHNAYKKAEHETVGQTRAFWRRDKLNHDIEKQHDNAEVEHHDTWNLFHPLSKKHSQHSIHSTHSSAHSGASTISRANSHHGLMPSVLQHHNQVQPNTVQAIPSKGWHMPGGRGHTVHGSHLFARRTHP